MSDLTRYQQGLTDIGGSPTLDQLQAEVNDHIAWLLEVGGLVPDSTLQDIADAQALVAGLLSTIEFTPSERHPEAMMGYAQQVIDLLLDGLVNDE